MVGRDLADFRTTLFSASQPSAASFFQQEQFDWSLHYNLLFHPVGLVSPDPFFFCPFVHNYLFSFENRASPDSRTWYEHALVEGLITPFVRDRSVGGFQDLWEKMAKSGLQGHYDMGREIAKKLDSLGGRSTPDHWRAWPDQMGLRFAALIKERFLLRDAQSMIPPNLRGEDADKYLAFLDRTEPFRVDDVMAAMDHPTPADGLRVTEIIRASGRRILGPDVRIDNLEELLAKMAAASDISNVQIEDARQFFKTLQELYNENLANAFCATKNVTNFDLSSRIFSAYGTREFELNDAFLGKPLFVDLEVPPVSMLRSLPFDAFLAKARSSKEFSDYRGAFLKWMNKSNDYSLGRDLTQALEGYVKRIGELCHESPRGWDLCRISVGYAPSALRFGAGVLKYGAAVSAAYVAHEEILGHFSGLAMAFSSAGGIAAAVGGHLVGKGVENKLEHAESAASHWLYIRKRQKITIVARSDSSIELHDLAKPRIHHLTVDPDADRAAPPP
jgi:hypothetical protein